MALRTSAVACLDLRRALLAHLVAISGTWSAGCETEERHIASIKPLEYTENHPGGGSAHTGAGVSGALTTGEFAFFSLAFMTAAQDLPRHYLFLPGGITIPMPPPGLICGAWIEYDIGNRVLYKMDGQLAIGDRPMFNVTDKCKFPSPRYVQFFEDIATGRFTSIFGVFFGVTPDQQVASYDTAKDELNILGTKQGWMDTDVPTSGRYSDHIILVSPSVGDGATIYRFSTETGQRSVWGSAMNPKDHSILALSQGDVQTVALLSRPSADPSAHPTVRVVSNDGSEQVVITSPLPNGAAIWDAELTKDNTLYLGAGSNEEGKGGIYRVDPGGVLQQVACARSIWWMMQLD